ncbi:hypothetical protein [Sphingobacterium bambusae]|uniref:RNA polymerase sigma factor 70 region 4 type 2 domain-containing protein n=1 Tax=Sphingobacterium bambusae TaxID=662858 RepID=A0ABW6BMB4_9SPHI|nr:hypothetical protein [Sphingobacterium bambusae]WPL47909.1 hypothetical protein SCB77_18325 [Sphingobacterium bambusae]
MIIEDIEKRFSAILAFQKKQMKYPQNSKDFDIYDKAIDLSLNSKRKVDAYFEWNLVRDARRIVDRQKRNTPKFVELYYDSDPYYHEEFFITTDTTDSIILTADLLLRIKDKCRCIHSRADEVLDGLISGQNCRELAGVLKVSESLIKKIRIKIRKEVDKIVKIKK